MPKASTTKALCSRFQLLVCGASQVALVVKNLPANVGDSRDTDCVSGLGRSPEMGIATNPSILACKIPGTVEPGGLQSMGLQRVGHN